MTIEQRKKYTAKILGKDASDCNSCSGEKGKLKPYLDKF